MNPLFNIHSRAGRNGPRPTGFTLIELLVVIAIIFVLLGTLLVALKTARRGAERADSLSALRGLMTAYTAYTTEHNNRLMPGYIDAGDLVSGGGTLDIKARLENGFDLTAADTSSYVWRLSPYMDHDWLPFMIDYKDKQLIGRLETEFGDGSAAGVYGQGTSGPNDLGIARVPSFGLNSIALGGDSFHGSEPDNAPWRAPNNKKPFVAQRTSDVLNPTKIIVFGASRMEPYPVAAPFNLDSITGYCELRPPSSCDIAGNLVSQWTIDGVAGSPTEGEVLWAGGIGGTPVSRLGDDRIPIAHLDGHVETEAQARLAADLTRWLPDRISQQ